MAKNRLFGWMFVEDSNKESEAVKPCTSQEASAPAAVAVPSPVVPLQILRVKRLQ